MCPITSSLSRGVRPGARGPCLFDHAWGDQPRDSNGTAVNGLVFVVSAEHAIHLDRALSSHLRHLQDAGVPAPVDLVELWNWAKMVRHGLASPLPLPEEEDAPKAHLLSLPQVAAELGCGVTKVKRLIAGGKLPTVLFEGVRRVRRADLEAYEAGLGDGR